MDTNVILEIVLTIVAAYLIGSIPTGYIVVKLFTGQDIRKIGSGSTGATNVKRIMGKKWFFIVMFLDALKGALPVFLAYYFSKNFQDIGLLPVLAAIFVILGHSKSIFLNFTGGKSVASGVGTIIALDWQAGLIIAVVWAAVTWVSRYVSLGSIVALALSPLIMWFLNAPIAYILYTVIAAVYVIYLHRENIQRLMNGTENKVR
ncbi:MAG TPA: acyl-phosphate glycerol 3-phosphate acyltransferase [Cyanobacteria bacterium UBA11991]|nr:glycerol-3-phosphate 1-O-acyltransferase PlsY [Cyanobacteriota bacterium]MDY6359041.1 glycerol-3-phosphate 1-O-acyltransferase PlsY [Cyanobacteriota bacterium]MDY6363483.1 glycerol-3-phosphate 1-O-acyltransferase PlsY [Cyanobacteriota bacterium]MDY6382670.1 glycerol-3-phosphate 1-O-acyltransferase PlsY [Cyanobacteriota bacterium]HCB11105.1 acyl-phosphate glycerol 3-phosphate acyltransferase [Cyanobacteria bacterium UBA11991]